MKRRRLVITSAVAAVCMLVALCAYSQSYNSLTPLLVDLPGWSGESPQGMDLDYSGTRAITATREYEQGDKTANAAIIVGRQMEGTWNAAYQEGFMMETTEISMAVERIRGFLVFHSFDKTSSNGVIVVLIQEASPDGSEGAVFSFAFEGVGKDEGMKLAQRFDWNKMKAAVSKL